MILFAFYLQAIYIKCVCKIVDCVAGDIKNILRLQAASNLMLRDIKQRLVKLENALQRGISSNDDNNQIISIATLGHNTKY